MTQRGFEVVIDEKRKFKEVEIQLPIRATKYSAGYDFFSNEDIVINPGQKHIFWMDLKAYMLPDEYLKIHIRSSLANKYGIVLKNQVGIIDSDYYSNIDNDGNIGICLHNTTDSAYFVQYGNAIAQGIFTKYLLTDDDFTTGERIGGIGSTTK